MSTAPDTPNPYGRRPLRNGHLDDSAQPWTTTRCHRLLRPLLSHISMLRKELSQSLCPTNDRHWEASARGGNPKKRAGAGDELAESRKRVRRTYSLKGAKKTGKRHVGESRPFAGARRQNASSQRFGPATNTGDLEASTPVLRRARGFQLSSPTQPQGPPDVEGRHRGGPGRVSWHTRPSQGTSVEEEWNALRYSVPACQYSILESILRGLDALLRSTAAASAGSGPGSLMAMCLRKVPEYILELDRQGRKEAEENGTKSLNAPEVSFEVYGDLESLGATGSGWKHLRPVVRAHGVRLLREAITDGLFDAPFVRLLINLCARHRAYFEAEELLEAMHVDRSFPPPTDSHSTFHEFPETEPLAIMTRYCYSTGRSTCLLRQTKRMLVKGSLPAAWLLTKEFGRIWSEAVRSLSRNSGCLEARDFTIACLHLLARAMEKPGRASWPGAHPKSRHDAMIGGLAILATMLTLGQEAMVEEGASLEVSTKITTTSRRLSYIIQACLAERGRLRHGVNHLSSYLLALSLYLTGSSSHGMTVAPDVESMLRAAWNGAGRGDKQTTRVKRQYKATVGLMCAIAHSCGRGTSRPSHGYLSELCNRIEGLGLENEPFRNVRADGAFCLADRTNDLRDLAFAEGLELPAGPKSAAAGDGGEKALFEGYRWDEGISEWVTASPALARSRVVPDVKQVGARGNVADQIDDCKEGSRQPVSADKPAADASHVSGSPPHSRAGGHATPERSRRRCTRVQSSDKHCDDASVPSQSAGGTRSGSRPSRPWSACFAGSSKPRLLADDDELLSEALSDFSERETFSKSSVCRIRTAVKSTTSVRKRRTLGRVSNGNSHQDWSDDELCM